VLVHDGKLAGQGHYWTYIRYAGAAVMLDGVVWLLCAWLTKLFYSFLVVWCRDIPSDSWMKYNDAQVTPVDEATV